MNLYECIICIVTLTVPSFSEQNYFLETKIFSGDIVPATQSQSEYLLTLPVTQWVN